MACFTFCSLGQVQLPEFTLNFTTLGFEYEGEATAGGFGGWEFHTWELFSVSVMSIIIPAIAILCFKNLKLQRKLCLIEILFIIVACIIAAFYGYTRYEGVYPGWSSAIISPLLALITDLIAYNRIGHDQKLLRSYDRLR
ncbi:MAG: DUF4293 domain-containing protein [Candidatus Amulumruptor caecigallinarius]|nr:DUF4293 domain-containing protein [Candidatus Amulumruptor caecigallinarius]